MGLRYHQTQITYRYLASIFCMTVIKESTQWETMFASTGVSLRQPDMNETYAKLFLSW